MAHRPVHVHRGPSEADLNRAVEQTVLSLGIVLAFTIALYQVLVPASWPLVLRGLSMLGLAWASVGLLLLLFWAAAGFFFGPRVRA